MSADIFGFEAAILAIPVVTLASGFRESTAGELNRLRAELASHADPAARLLAERDEARTSLHGAQNAVGDLRQDNGRMTEAIVELAQRYGRYGYRRITALLRAEGYR